MTKKQFAEQYRQALLSEYDWAKEPDKLERFMESVWTTLNGGRSLNMDGPIVVKVWRAIGGKGRPSYKALQALAD